MIGRTNANAGNTAENLNITLITNQSDHSDLIGANIKVIYADKEQNYTYAGTMIIIKIPAYADYTVSFSEVDGYKTPDNIIGTAIADNSKTFTAEYKTELVSITSNAKGAPITINGVKYTYDGNPITVKIAHGTEYQVIPENFDNLYTTDNFSYTANTFSRTIACTYTTSTLKVAITSNQSNDNLVSNIKITVKYGSTTTTVGNGEEINIPINTSITLTIPGKGVNGYKGTYSGTAFTSDLTKTITNAGGQKLITVAYTTVLLTVNITSDGTMPTGYSATISQSGGPSYTQTTATATHKIIPGTSVTISASNVDGYGTPVSVTNSYSINSTVEMQYTENSTGVYIRTYSDTEVKWDQWSESTHGTAFAIVIHTEDHTVAIPHNQPYTYGVPWSTGHNNVIVDGILAANYRNQDLLGKENTDLLRSYYQFDAGTESAFSYVCVRGKNYYLGGLGEWYIIGNNITEVNQALIKVGSTFTFDSDTSYWSSTQSNTADHAWVFYFVDYGDPDLSYNATTIPKTSVDDGGFELRTIAFYKL